ncbi:putative alpha,alpha-trehalose-phosphate synthase [UDP-forming] [Phytophthora cinnamomi]|uniref:putative alpha,alpha-trehalose-phosphate synthase [UDP-forming] n=1 Tax=Phytophthora cinnamomi TaxID=4785 RepID=UPI0035594469|nr:putative alpha,alpha-trehalose-phosphate synthase [UDP-forming] [Phytophthora cinnamomi]
MMSLDWEACCCILKQLQTAAHVVHGSLSRERSVSNSKRALQILLLKILNCLQRFRNAIDTSFLQDRGEITSQQENSVASTVTQGQMEEIAELLNATQICTRCKIPTIENIQHERQRRVQEELAAVAQLEDMLSSGNLPGARSADTEKLKLLITRLRQQEQLLDFHRGLLKAQQEFSGPDSEYSAENFAFGSTPFSTWLNLFTQGSVLDAIARSPKHTKLTVFGSSSGSLVLFAAIALGLSCVGVEILPFLHDVAERTREELCIPSDKCRFICADMLAVPVQDTSILLLTSQCWDTQLHQHVQRKLETELQPGTLVLDYKNTLQGSRHFRMVQHLAHQRVSWTTSQSLFIFERLN